jgi:hypothetical protein
VTAFPFTHEHSTDRDGIRYSLNTQPIRQQRWRFGEDNRAITGMVRPNESAPMIDLDKDEQFYRDTESIAFPKLDDRQLAMLEPLGARRIMIGSTHHRWLNGLRPSSW